MEEIKVGEYVRTNKGIIARCIKDEHDRYVFDKVVIEEGYYNDYIFKDIPERGNFIKSHSFNIIDLIQVRRSCENGIYTYWWLFKTFFR